jgi:hypothetical protein
MAGLAHLDNTASVDDLVGFIERDGGAIIDDFLSAEEVDEFTRDMRPYLDSYENCQQPFSGLQTKRVGAVFGKSRKAADVATHALYLGAAERLIDKPFSLSSGEGIFDIHPGLRIGVTQVIQIGPGQGAQGLHRDQIVVLWRNPEHQRDIRLQIMVALTDFTAENGGTNIIPGSHKWDADRIPDPAEAVPTEMKAGSAAMFLGTTYHGGGANRTQNEFRIGFTMALDSALIRQEENMYLALSPDVVRSYPEEVQRLLGWSSHPTLNTGWVDIDGDMADANRVLGAS